MKTIALLLLRVTVGGLLAGHGAQKLFGWFEGPGMQGTTGWLESMGFRPGRYWAFAAGASEFFGGVLTAVGMLNPIGPLMAIGAMLTATFKVHAGKPIWVTAGGAELTLTNAAALMALALTGPGRISADRALGIRLPRWLAIPGLAVVATTVWLGLRYSAPKPESIEQEAGGALQAGETRLEDETSLQPGADSEDGFGSAAEDANEQGRIAAMERIEIEG
jgi:putative oxidoreductase